MLYFVFETRKLEGFELIRNALHRDDRLALDAIAITCALLEEGYDLGLAMQADLDDFVRRFPDSSLAHTACDLVRRSPRRQDEIS